MNEEVTELLSSLQALRDVLQQKNDEGYAQLEKDQASVPQA